MSGVPVRTPVLTPARTPADLIVIGGGIGGLVVAAEAARGGLRVTLLEAAPTFGGLLARGEVDGVALDLGAESFATRTSGVSDLVTDAGLDLVLTSPAPGGAHLVGAGPDGIRRAPLPTRTVLGIPADPGADDVVRILGTVGAARVAAERTVPWDPALREREPSLADLVAHRCGTELVERLVEPLCRSVYSVSAADARLSVLHPALWRESVARGSLGAAAAAIASTERAGSAVGGIVGGMWRLADSLRAAAIAHGAELRSAVAVRGLVPAAGVVHVRTGDAELSAHRVVVATGSGAARALLGQPAAPTPRVRVVAVALRSAALDARPVGSGVIVAPEVPSAAKALTHVNAKWPWMADRMPAGRHIVRLSARDADAAGLDTPDDLAREITLLTGVPIGPGDVIAVTSAVWSDVVPSAPLGAEHRTALARSGIRLAGAAAAGTGLASVIPHARALAHDLLSPAPVLRSTA